MSRCTRLREALAAAGLHGGCVPAWRAAARERDLLIGKAQEMADLDAAFVV